MISVTEALDLILTHRCKGEIESSALLESLGATCAEDVLAKHTMPPFDASAMDGYAVKLADVARAGTTLSIIGEAPAGSPYKGDVNTGEAVRIFTGSPLPNGANHIVIQENVSRTGNMITVNTADESVRHVRTAGIDFCEGDVLIPKGSRMGPAEIALAASGNHANVRIFKRPKVAIIANGDELRPPGSALKDGQIVSSNALGLSALIRHWGGVPLDVGIASDTLESIAALIDKAKGADIMVPVGGASVGDYDFMRQAFSNAGFKSLFEKIAVKPGKPTWFGALGKARVLGLPGNPSSAYVCAHLFLKPLMHAVDSLPLCEAVLDSDINANGSRETYLRGRLYISQHGQLSAQPFPRQDSSLISPLARSNALIQLPVNSGPWTDGDTINVVPLGMGPDIL